MSVRAKFWVTFIGPPSKTKIYKGLDEKGQGVYEEVDVTSIYLAPVTTNSEENKKFFASTPGGNLNLSIIHKAVADQFVLGKEYYIDFTEAPNG